ncbi:MAG: prenylated flavin chaperone LpdD [Candidatus Hodarchaeales archaeon]|jgi:hypothetical protein
MRKITEFEAFFGTYKFQADVYLKKNGLLVEIISPNDHLGGIGIGIPYCRADGSKSSNYHSLSVPAHRDSELAGKLAQIIAKITQTPVVVILGVHIPNITPKEILDLFSFFENWFREIGQIISNDISLD